MTRHVAISCHDFLADWGGGEALRTRRAVEEFLALHGFLLRPRADAREWVRDCVYADRPGIEQGAAGTRAASMPAASLKRAKRRGTAVDSQNRPVVGA